MGSEVAELKKLVESLQKEVTRVAGKLFEVPGRYLNGS